MHRIIRSLSTLLFALAVTAGAATAQGPDLPNEQASEQGQENQQVIADCLEARGEPGDDNRGIGECVSEEKPSATVEEHGQSGEHGRPDATGRPEELPTPQGQPDTTGRPESPGQSEANPPGPRR